MGWYQGALTHGRRTRYVTEAVVIFVLTISAALWAGVAWGQVAGVFVGWTASSLGMLAQTGWLWFRSQAVLRPALAETPAAGWGGGGCRQAS